MDPIATKLAETVDQLVGTLEGISHALTELQRYVEQTCGPPNILGTIEAAFDQSEAGYTAGRWALQRARAEAEARGEVAA